MKNREQNREQIQVRGHEENHVGYCLFTFVSRFYTFVCLLFPLLLLPLSGISQSGAEIGILGGKSYYFGEYNTKHFKNSQQYIGGLFRFNLNDRFALRFNVGISEIKGSNTLLTNGGTAFSEEFNCKVRDFSGVVEFNFRSFMVKKTDKSSWWTPYIFTGIGFFVANDEGSLSIPIGVGMKFNLYRNFSCGVEWSTRKLFTDMIDQLEDPWGTGETNFIYNKDWFFVAGVTLTYRFPTDRSCFY